MKLEDQVVSLELVKKMKELGFPQDTLWYWVLCDWNVDYEIVPFESFMYLSSDKKEVYEDYGHETGSYDIKEIYSAPTPAELGEALPEEMNCAKYNNKWIVYNFRNVNGVVMKADTEADARAKMIIYLIENGLLKLKENKLI